jgi:phosphate starvation-inducible PhoH-like protein
LASEEKYLTLEGIDLMNFGGINDRNIDKIRGHFKSNITLRGEKLTLKGEGEELAQLETIFKELMHLQKRQGKITESDVNLIIELVKGSQVAAQEKKLGIKTEELDDIILVDRNDFVKPKTMGQRELFLKTQQNEIVFAIGPAGTGKTYLSVAIALAALRAKKVNRIILSRPAVEAGESLGFLPGDLSEKVNPYLKPLYDALEDMVPMDRLKYYFERNVIEIIPLAYMRGRTLNNAFMILDEAQNSTALQMKMFLTRLGVNSNAIITGDITQIDLPSKQASGLVQIQNILQGVDGIGFIYLGKKDVVRHKLVKDIINAYENFSASNGSAEKKESPEDKPDGNNKNENGK